MRDSGTWLSRCSEVLPRPVAAPGPDHILVDWREYCDPAVRWLRACVEEWQERGQFRHHRAGTVLVAFRAGWLATSATVPEYHLGAPLPSLAGARAVLDSEGRLMHLSLSGSDQVLSDADASADAWWSELHQFFAPLAEGLAAVGGPPADSDQYWGNPVGLVGEVLRRVATLGAPGDVRASAHRLRAASGREHLLVLRNHPDGSWSRRRTCCQWWRRDGGYCTDCVLHDSPVRAR
ncbi:(2Fe-2S)-binding protein [Streptoalloteichus hindustanus]|uniref:FhuF 2Fe-2S C-terminal domain-containing protein n=1 Tax=Streptoalloteichus hindustanus TaxID=2017 RepID=A0A1M5LCN5_STRHI|nr:(2Fe-2S)-binding protein [Streptoalloteichus hindustanus]SHG62720.1 FhuF 2Fe-2S C-terminal domain-containing protein [Streptoalloteichus hindustanus]